MPGPTHAPERVRPASMPTRDATPGMSMQRRYRLRRTIVGAAVLLLGGLAATRLLGDETPAATAKNSTAVVTSATRGAAPAPSTRPGASSSTSATSTKTVPATVPASGDGKITVLPTPGHDTTRKGATKTFTIEAEGGLGIDLTAYAGEVRSILSSDKGWEVADGIHFKALTPADLDQGSVPDVRITLASPDLTDELCAPLNTGGEVSCNRHGRAVINAKRWAIGVKYYDDLTLYRTYLINHEVGHGLWHQHAFCPGAGQKAPIMQQQTLGLQGCTAWPYPVTS